jgi:hypothetical protein
MRFVTTTLLIGAVLLLFDIGGFTKIGASQELQQVSGAPGSLHALHRSPPLLQIGDIQRFLAEYSNTSGKEGETLVKFVGDTYIARFALSAPSVGNVKIKIFSLVRKDHARLDCKTTLQINDGKEFDLRDGFSVGSGRMTTFSAKASFVTGENRVTIKEHDCFYTNTPALNDSLLVSAEILFASNQN